MTHTVKVIYCQTKNGRKKGRDERVKRRRTEKKEEKKGGERGGGEERCSSLRPIRIWLYEMYERVEMCVLL